ncbi:hypothetical protein A3SI_15393 [Nitritalea halalkaliphila LW7]|uniref:Uncharacterized protein n=1 Tax=Nitritalea halalkaliphila LW7 TaxID=1189621 RepID=I5BYD0_9BACT|nr:hypothetical protein [Nitritalea halalkaliphila]EIM74582.1 hypothetical protein A3SI_15393 [Nitritalea halalkaliphila LW7]
MKGWKKGLGVVTILMDKLNLIEMAFNWIAGSQKTDHLKKQLRGVAGKTVDAVLLQIENVINQVVKEKFLLPLNSNKEVLNKLRSERENKIKNIDVYAREIRVDIDRLR